MFQQTFECRQIPVLWAEEEQAEEDESTTREMRNPTSSGF
jgi:hypothetical protein